MVSTRQMATNSGCSTTSNQNSLELEAAARLSVPTGPANWEETTATPSGSGSIINDEIATTSTVALVMQKQQTSTNLLEFPTEIITLILNNLKYKEIAQVRQVCSQLNVQCMRILNSAFNKLLNQISKRLQEIKFQMPRRDSSRRKHPLAIENDIIDTCNMRLVLLKMAMGKHIERDHCCFFPGAILDEVVDILKYIHVSDETIGHPFRITDELFDLSTMAIEYFRDFIEPKLPPIGYFKNNYYKIPTIVEIDNKCNSSINRRSLPAEPPQSNMVLRKGIREIKQGMKIYNNQLSVLRTELRNCKRKSLDQSKEMVKQQKLLLEQQKQMLEYANRLEENEKKTEEMSCKFSTLLQELNKCKTELQYWRSKSPAPTATMLCCNGCNNQRLQLPAVDNDDVDAALLNSNGILDAEHVDVAEEFVVALQDEFAKPDVATTTKLLRLNKAAKRLKRQHADDADNLTSEKGFPAAAVVTTSIDFGSSGYSPRLFYGNNNNNKTVIMNSQNSTTMAAGSKQTCNMLQNNLSATTSTVDVLDAVESAVAALTVAYEHKKARRVQKSNTRCVGGTCLKRAK